MNDALTQARKLVNCPTGRFTLVFAPDMLSTVLEDQQSTREIAALLQRDIRHCLQVGNLEGAWISLRALVNTGRAIGDEPLIISQLIRLAMQSIAIECLERVLSQGEIGAASLEAMQKSLDAEAAENLFVIGMRGERAGFHQMCQNIDNGTISLMRTLENSSRKSPRQASFWDGFHDFFAASMVRHSNAWLLRNYSAIIAAAELHGFAKYEELQVLDETAKDALRLQDRDLILAKLLFPYTIKVAQAEQRIDTRLHCACAALAAERFRLKYQRWPASLEELVLEKLLEEVPEDQFDGQPLRFRRT
ncbi:MAG: hypothetical protein L0Z53_10085, partial [Acidobacteriales bacterium]|nr:hypothetical protein [Terriglobales bacterium]